ncbi:hypothetical protein SXCC_00256 [Gluconacetobacter sp. SXCC-1]|nr:hypothetical protein SXCC_00256 [Gluconacetobacter sp. SXCC-1]
MLNLLYGLQHRMNIQPTRSDWDHYKVSLFCRQHSNVF